MISYAKYKTKPSILEYSIRFSTLLGDSRTVKATFDMKKKVPENSQFFSKVPETSMIEYFNFLDD